MHRCLTRIPHYLAALIVGTVAVAAEPESRTASLNGIEMHYESSGDGPAVVLLHGFFGCAKQWRPLAESLSGNFRVIVPDLRGHGRSTNPDGTFDHRQSARDLLALMDALEIERLAGVGYSSGAATLLHAASRQPKRIRAMVVSGMGMHLTTSARELVRGLSTETAGEANLEEWRGCAARGEDQVRELVTLFNSFADVRGDLAFTPPLLEAIEARVLIVHGDRDMFFPAHHAAAMHRAIPDSALWIVPNAGHEMYFEPLDLFFERIHATLAESGERTLQPESPRSVSMSMTKR